ncbi:hypothetical protein ACFQH6_04025 [Halobacteriaceae archaeon GCM10025711]
MYDLLHISVNHTAPLVGTIAAVGGFAAAIWLLLRVAGKSDFKRDAGEQSA